MISHRHVQGIDHVAIAVPDLEKALVLYTEVMGFELQERRTTEGTKTAMVSAVLKAGSTLIVLVQGVGPESQVSRYVENYGPGVQHVALLVEDLPKMIEDLKERGLEFDAIVDSPGLRQAFTHRDEESGMMFELIERLGGEFTDESVADLFRQLESSDSY